MRKLLAAMFVTLLMAGRGEEPGGGDPVQPLTSAETPPESNRSSVETPDEKTAQVGKIDLDDSETLDKIIAEAIDREKNVVVGLFQKRGNEGEKIWCYEQTPYSGWVKDMHDNGQIEMLLQFKDGKVVTAVHWKINGEKCPHAKVMNGNGVWVVYSDGECSSNPWRELWRNTYRDGVEVYD